jgi:hypothetical protein
LRENMCRNSKEEKERRGEGRHAKYCEIDEA